MNILISGGSDGIGLAIAKMLQEEHNIVIMAPNEEKLIELSQNNKFIACVGDVTKWEDCQNAVDYTVQTYRSLDVIISSAGLEIYGELENCDPERIRRVVEVNYLGMIYSVKAAIPELKKSKYPLVININSQASTGVSIGRSIYYSSKWATNGFTKNIAKELAQYGIKTTSVYPGAVSTKFGIKAGKDRDMSDAVTAEDVAKAVKFVVDQDRDVVIPEIGVKHVLN